MKTFIAFLSIAFLTVAARAGEKSLPWPQFRGPGGGGVAAEGQKPPIAFGPNKNVKWKVDAPSGMSSPIIAGDFVVITAFENGKLLTIAYSRTDGKEAWRAEARAKKLEVYNKALSSPAAPTSATDGKRIVTYFGSCGLICYDLAGKELWKYELPPAVLFGNFGSGVSPVIADGKVVLQRDVSNDAKILAVNLDSGKLAWEKKRLSQLCYGTPVVLDTPGG
jgi:outer membrane protein assembly factor BamB